MKYSQLGRTGMRASRIALGTATFGVAPDPDEAERMVRVALDAGVNVFDCANSYGNQSRFDRPDVTPADQRASAEEILGGALDGRRDEVILCTKVREPVGDGVNDHGLSRRHVFQQVDASLRRLRTDRIDIYYAHHPDPDTPIEETLRAFDDLIRMGKIHHYALSTYPAWRVVEALWKAERGGLSAPACHQIPYNLGFRAVEKDILPTCTEFEIPAMVFGPLGGGAFAGPSALERPIAGHKRWGGPSLSERQLSMGRRLNAIAEEGGYAPAQLAIAWLLTRPGVCSAIIGPEDVGELTVNAGAADLELPDHVLAAVDAIGIETDAVALP
jgi:aryl-alcohol dehydrogenase-like predicted oxidoreductase